MDPVQHDLNQLGVKPSDPADYNIHIPPLPREGKDEYGLRKYPRSNTKCTRWPFTCEHLNISEEHSGNR